MASGGFATNFVRTELGRVESWGALAGRVAMTSTGKRFYVHSGTGNANNGGLSPDDALATIDQAVNKCTASKGDVILVMPGHAESIAAAAGIDADIAGIFIIGVGNDENRPVVTFTTAAAADVDIDAANVTIANMVFKNDIDEQDFMIDVNSTGFTLEGCEFVNGSAKECLTFVDLNGGTANACDRMTVRGCRFTATAAAGSNNAIGLDEVADRVLIEDCIIDGDFADAGIHNPTGKVLTNLVLRRNVVRNRQTGDHAVELVSACTGEAVDNRLFGDTSGTIFDPGSLFCAGNAESAAIDEPGVPTPLAVPDVATNLLGVDDANNVGATTNVAANEDGTVLERLEQVQEAVNRGTGTSIAANKSLADAIGFDGSSAVSSTAGMLRTAAGTRFILPINFTSSAIPNNTQTSGDITGAASGNIFVESITLETDATGIAGPTNLEISTDNAKGLTGAGGQNVTTAVSGLGANKTVNIRDAASETVPFVLESGKKVFVHGDDAAGTGGGVTRITLVCVRMSDGASLAAGGIGS